MSFSLTENFNIFAFKDKEMDALYFSMAMIHFAIGLVSVFVPIYLYELGIPIWHILIFYFLRSVYYLFFGTTLLPVMRRLSDKILMTMSSPFLVLYFLGLNFLSGTTTLFYILPAAAALQMLFLYVGYHMDFAIASDDDHMGEEVGVRFLISALVKFSTPFLGGVIIGLFGFGQTFLAASLVLILAMVPLFFFPRRRMPESLNLAHIWQRIKSKKLRRYNISAFGYGSEKMVPQIIWPLFLFIILGGVEQLGGVISAGFFAGAVMSFTLGKAIDIDMNRENKVIKFSAEGLSFVWLIRTFITQTVPAVGSHIVENLFRNTLYLGWTTRFYRIVERQENPGVFIMGQEFIYHISRVVILPVFVVFAYLLSQQMFFVASFVLASLLSLLFLFSLRYDFVGAEEE